MKTLAEKIAIMQAYLDGKSIEFSFDGESYRPVLVEPDFDWRLLDYRVKPEIREGWVNIYKNKYFTDENNTGLYAGTIYYTEKAAILGKSPEEAKTVKITWEE